MENYRQFWILVIAVVSIKAQENEVVDQFNNAKINCFIRHLQGKRLLRDNFEEFPVRTNFNQTNCENFVKTVENFYYQRIKNGTSFNVEVPDFQELLENQGDCIEKELRVRQYGDLFLKSLIYDALKPLSRNLEVERNQTTKQLKEALASAISSCTFSALYDTYARIRRNNYCARKYVVDNDIMGMKSYNLTLNPFHIDVSKINCTEIIEKQVNDLGTDSDGDVIELGKSDAIGLLSHEWAVIFLTEIRVSEEDWKKEKEKYEEGIKELSGDLN